MKKIFHKNQIIITALALMIVVAGYLNFTGQDIATGNLLQKDASQTTVNTDKNKEQSSDKDKATQTAKPTQSSKSDKKTAQKDAKKEETAESDAMTKDISQEDESDLSVADSGEIVSSQENPGEAVMVSNTIRSDYFSSAKLSREQTRAKNKETLLEIVNNKQISSADKKKAVDEVAQLTALSEKENAAEMMLQAKGFEDAMVSLSEKNADVVINAEELSSKEMAQIMDIVKRKTELSAENIVITPVQVEKKK
ncbi:MAG: SpoIIIAH-like family protein [Lachnospiraceae bacterium]|nr:SpoIIIAH-like family protein [Lachnospiraceae bacterium]